MFGIDMRTEALSERFLRVFVTDRRSCARSLADQVLLLQGEVDVVILREKDLDAEAYERLAREVAAACAGAGIALVPHTHADAARRLGCAAIHLPLPQLRAQGRPEGFGCVGTNVHAMAEVDEAEAVGADVLIAGPVFQPSCKPDARPAGLSFLRSVVQRAHVPVLALGGVTDENEALVRAQGATGACRMADYARR